jgi:hypothetical protein
MTFSEMRNDPANSTDETVCAWCIRRISLIKILILSIVIIGALPFSGSLSNVNHDAVLPGSTIGLASAGETDIFAVTPEQAASEIDEGFARIDSAASRNDLRFARQQVSMLSLKIEKYKKVTNRDRRKSDAARLQAFNVMLKSKVDSLVKVNIAIVEKSGKKAGYEFRQYCSTKAGLSETELAPVDAAIVESGLNSSEEATPSIGASQPVIAAKPGGESTPATIPNVKHPVETAPVAPPAPATPQKILTPEQLRANEENERNREAAMAKEEKIRSLVEEGKIEEAATVFQIYQASMQRFLDRDAFEALKSKLETAQKEVRERHARAAERMQAIDKLLDQGRVLDASNELRTSRDDLQKDLDPEEMRRLDKRVGQAYVGYLQKQAATNGTMRTIRDLIAGKKGEEAWLTFDKARQDLERYLAEDAFKALEQEVEAVYGDLRDTKKFAELRERQIHSLVKVGKGGEAYARFQENRPLLARYLDPGRYSALESETVAANTKFTGAQHRAFAMLRSVDSLIDRSNLDEANDLFDETGDKIRRDLADDKRFFETKERLLKATDDRKEKRRDAARVAKKLGYLISNREGRKANALFNKETPLLRGYLGPSDFMKIEGAVRRAAAEYESKYAAARTTLAQISSLLDARQVERAYAVYKKAQDDLEFYLEEDQAAAAVRKRVTDAYDSLQERRDQAAAAMKEIRKLIEKRRGDIAYSQFLSVKGSLDGYADPKAVAALGAAVAKANGRYFAEKSRAEQQEGRLRSLVAQKQVEDAYAAFDTLEPDLRFYLTEKRFQDVKALVEQSNEVLQGKKKEALRIVKTVNGLIEDERGDSAFTVFTANRTFLSTYCGASTVTATARRVDRAKADYARNCEKAKSLGKKLQKMAHDKHEEAANNEFDDRRDFLEHYLGAYEFARVKTAVSVPYEAFLTERKKARALVATLEHMIKQRQGVEARVEFERNDRILGRYLPAKEYLEIATEVTAGYDKTVQGRREAASARGKIRSLLADGKITEAHRVYQDTRPTLELYMSSADYSRLQTEVTYAWEEQEKKVRQAREYAKTLRQLVAKKHYWDAYKGFRFNRRDLAEYLDAQEFADLQAAIEGSYEAAKAKARKEK